MDEGWNITLRKDPLTGELRAMKILILHGNEVERHWIKPKNVKKEINQSNVYNSQLYVKKEQEAMEMWKKDIKEREKFGKT